MGMRLCIKDKQSGTTLFYGSKYICYQDLTHSWCMHYVWHNLKDICDYDYEYRTTYMDYIYYSIECQNVIAYIGDFKGLKLMTFIMLYIHDTEMSKDCQVFRELINVIEYIRLFEKYDALFEVSVE